MATLQEVECNTLPIEGRGDKPRPEKGVVAIHRRSKTLLSMYIDETTGNQVYESNARNKDGQWQACAKPWQLTPNSPWVVAKAVVIEALDCFLFVCNNSKSKTPRPKPKPLPAHASLELRRQREKEEAEAVAALQTVILIFCDLSLVEVNRYNISTHTKNTVSAADFDQQRKELLLGCLGGRVQSYAVRFIEPSRQAAGHYIGVFRLQTRLPDAAGKRPLQLITQDVAETSLILSKRGGITSVANGTLDRLWFVSSDFFRYEPVSIFGDKFGANFLVHCVAEAGSAKKEVLEYWKPPPKFFLAEAGQFERAVLPLGNASLSCLTLECISPETGVFVVLMTDDGAVQLWRPTGGATGGDIILDSEIMIKLTNSNGNSSIMPAIEPSIAAMSLSVASVASLASSGASARTATIKPPALTAPPPENPKNRCRSGLISFLQNSELPDCPISLVATYGSLVCELALHAPSDIDSNFQRTLTEISLNRLAASASHDLAMNGGYMHMDMQEYFGGAPASAEQFFAAKRSTDMMMQARDMALREKKLLEALEREPLTVLNSSGIVQDATQSKVISESAYPERAMTPFDDNIDLNSRANTAGDAHPHTQALDVFAPRMLNSDLEPGSPNGSELTDLSPVFGLSRNNSKLEEVSEDINSVPLGYLEQDWDELRPFPPQQISSRSSFRSGLIHRPPHRNSNSMPAPQKPTAFFYMPLRLIQGYDRKIDDASKPDGVGALRILKAPSLLLSTSRKGSSLSAVTEKGFFPVSKSLDRILDFNFVGIATKAASMGLVTILNQGFVFDVRDIARNATTLQSRPPIRLDLNIRQQASATAILVADVSVMVARAQNLKGRTELVEEDMDGIQTLCFFGDSDGKLNYCLCDRDATIYTNSFPAHSSPVVAIVATGDASSSTWRLSTVRIPRKKEVQVFPRACPGSAIVSLSKAGEVKVWQPIFIDQHSIASSRELIFNVCGLEWKCMGTFTCRVPNPTAAPALRPSGAVPAEEQVGGYATQMFLDPAAVTVIIAFNDGSLEQWPIPGLLSHVGLATTREAVWRKKRHRGAIENCRVHMHLASTCVKTVKQSDLKHADVDAKKKDLNPIVSLVSSCDSEESIGYTLKDLKTIADSSSLVTSSTDCSVVLWRFSVSTDERQSTFKFLNPSPIRRFVFSNVPSCGMCFTTSDSTLAATQSVWRLTAVVNGVLITATHGERSEAFRVNKSLIADADFHAAAVVPNPSQAFRRGAEGQPLTLQAVPVICPVDKPSLTADACSRKVDKKHGDFSWNVLDFWTMRTKAENDKLLSQKFALDANLTFDGVRQNIPSAGVAWQAEQLSGEVKKIDVLVEVTKDYKPESERDGKKKVYFNGTRLSVAAGASITSVAKLFKDDEGFEGKFLVSSPLRDLAAIEDELSVGSIDDELDLSGNDGLIGSPLRQQSVDVGSYALIIPGSASDLGVPSVHKSDEESVISLNSAARIKEPMTDSLITMEIASPVQGSNSLAVPFAELLQDSKTSNKASKQNDKNHSASKSLGKDAKAISAEEEVEVGKIVGEFGEIKQTRIQQLRKKQLDKEKARQMASTSINPKVMYRSKPRETAASGTRQVSGSAAMFTVPLNYSDQQVIRAGQRVVVNLNPSKPRVEKTADLDEILEDDAPPAASLKLGLSPFKFVTEDGKRSLEEEDGRGLRPIINFSAPSIYYGAVAVQKTKYVPRKDAKPKIDPSLIPEVNDGVSLVGQALMGQLNENQMEGLNCLVDLFSEKDMDAFESLSDENKMIVLAIIGDAISKGKKPGCMLEVLKQESAKKGQVKLKQIQLEERNTVSRKGGVSAMLQVADPEASPDLLLALKSADIYALTVTLMTPNTAVKAFVFAMLDSESAAVLPSEELFEAGDEAAIRKFAGICAVSTRILDEKQTEHSFELTSLKPSRSYKIFGYLCCSTPAERTFRRMVVEESVESILISKTLPEIVDMHWKYLTPEMQDIEVKAALRSKMVIAASQTLERALVLPVEADFAARDPDTSAGRAALKKVQMFTNWWAPDAQAGLSEIRQKFLFREALYAVKNDEIVKRYRGEGFIGADDLKVLHAAVDKVAEDPSADKLAGSLLDGNQAFFTFRSWYIGGQVVLDYEETEWAKKKKSKDPSSPARSLNPSVDNSHLAMSDDDVFVGESPDANEGDFAQTPLLQMKRRTERSSFLVDCYTNNVDSSKNKTVSLIETYKTAEKLGLSERDLTLRRAKLTDEDIDMIMASMKLIDLCIAREIHSKGKRLDPSMLGKGVFTAQNICGCDLFAPINEAVLIPEKPPSITLATLPGSNRRPIRPWQVCSPEEQNLELALACSLDFILEIAIVDGVSVPEMEDLDLDSKVAPLRSQRWKDFVKWYSGGEGAEKVPGKGVPSLARVLVAEQWEAKTLYNDYSVLNAFVQLGVSLPDDIKEFNAMRIKAVADAGSDNDVEPLPQGLKDDLMIAYETSLNNSIGIAIRTDMFKYALNTLIRSRRQEMVTLLWPPGPARAGHQFLFPRLGLITPQIEMPPVRIKLFPSKGVESWTHAQILNWYSPEILDEDDLALVEAELDGQRRRAYLEWLALESERLKQGRIDMLAEDKAGQVRRRYDQIMETKFGAISRLPPDQNKKAFSLSTNLPGEYGFIKDTTPSFDAGTGVDNEDELEDIRLAQVAAADKARAEAAEKKRKYDLEMRRRAREEEQRVRREETDRRLAENTERRRLVREQIEDLKQRRAQDAENERRAAVQRAEAEEIEKLRVAEERRLREAEANRLKVLNQDRLQMVAEDDYMHSYITRSVETRIMEHEDIISTMREMAEKRTLIANQRRIAELREIYEPHVPYVFKKELVRMPVLHSILSDSVSDSDQFASIYRSKMSFAGSQSVAVHDVAAPSYVAELQGFSNMLMFDEHERDSKSQGDGQSTADHGWGKETSDHSVGSHESRPLTAEESELLGQLSVDESFINRWFRSVPRDIDDLQALLMSSIKKTQASIAISKKKKRLKPSDQEPLIWKGLSQEALLILQADKVRYEVSKGLNRPKTSGGVPVPSTLTQTEFPVTKYVLTDRLSPIRRPNTSDGSALPRNSGGRLSPLNLPPQGTALLPPVQQSPFGLGENNWDKINASLEQAHALAEQIGLRKQKLNDALSKSAEVALSVMQNQRLQALQAKKLAVASLAAVDNYDDSGKRRHKPKNVVETRREPLVHAERNRSNREAIRVYVDSGAVSKDKFYLDSILPGIRAESSIDEVSQKFLKELEEPAESSLSPKKLPDFSIASLTKGMNKKHSRMEILRSDTGQPHDPKRFGPNNRHRSGVVEPQKGFGILGNSIDIKNVDVRKRGLQGNPAAHTKGLHESASELQLGSHFQASATDNSLLTNGARGHVIPAPPVNGGGDDTSHDLAQGSMDSLLTTESMNLESFLALAASQDSKVVVGGRSLELDVGDDTISVNSNMSDNSRGKSVMSKPASITVSVRTTKSAQKTPPPPSPLGLTITALQLSAS